MEGPSSGLNIVIGGGEDDHHDYIMDLPPGFRFHPTDEEIITHYLTQKVMNSTFCARAVGEVDLNKCEPWDLPKKAKLGEKEWYFFCQRDRKYPTGMRTNRATESGYWKATGKDKEIYKKGRGGGGGGGLVGMKKTLVFYKGRAPKGEKTNWVMHEYRLEGQFSYYNFPKPAKDEWVVSRVFHKSTGLKRGPISPSETRMNSFVDDFLDSPSLPPLMEPPNYSNAKEIQAPGSSFTDGEDDTKGKATASSSSARSSDGGDYLSYFSMDLNNVKNHFMMPNSTNYNNNSYQANNNSYQASLMSSSNPPTLDSIFQNPIHFPMSNVRPFESYPSPGHSNQDRVGGPPSFTGHSNDRTILRALKSGATASTEIDDRDHDHDQKQYCKMEQLSSTQDTGCLSGDMTTAETSSVISKKDMGSNSNISNYHEDFEDPTPVDPISDNLNYLWNY